MGNCCKAESGSSSMEWGGEDWSDLNPKKNNTENRKRRSSSLNNKVFDEGQVLSIGKAQKEKLFGELGANICDNQNNNNGSRIKIRISKKELARLLSDTTSTTTIEEQRGKLKHRASAEQVLQRLLKARDDEAHNIHTPWKPQLDSIPEEDR